MIIKRKAESRVYGKGTFSTNAAILKRFHLNKIEPLERVLIFEGEFYGKWCPSL